MGRVKMDEKDGKILKIEKELVELYTKENDELQDELIDLLKETEEKAFVLREKIAENKRFINSMKLRQPENNQVDF